MSGRTTHTCTSDSFCDCGCSGSCAPPLGDHPHQLALGTQPLKKRTSCSLKNATGSMGGRHRKEYDARKRDLAEKRARAPNDDVQLTDAGERLAAYLVDFSLAWADANPTVRNKLMRELLMRQSSKTERSWRYGHDRNCYRSSRLSNGARSEATGVESAPSAPAASTAPDPSSGLPPEPLSCSSVAIAARDNHTPAVPCPCSQDDSRTRIGDSRPRGYQELALPSCGLRSQPRDDPDRGTAEGFRFGGWPPAETRLAEVRDVEVELERAGLGFGCG